MDHASERARLAELLARRDAPLTPNQRSLWAWEQLEPGHPALMLSSEWELSCSEPPERLGRRLREAFSQLARRHVNLRTIFPGETGTPRPQSWDGELDYRELEVGSGAMEETLLAERMSRFELGNQPPLRVRLLRGDSLVLHFKLHHIACDWWSMLLLVEELEALLKGQKLPALGVDFPTYARWQSAWLEGPEPDALLSDWRKELSSPRPDLRLPADFPPQGAYRCGAVSLPLASGVSRRLRNLAQETRCSLTAVLLAGYSQALSRACRENDVTVAMPCGARWRSQFRNLLGPLYNILPLRMRLEESSSLRALVGQASEVLERALTRQDLPFPILVEGMRPRRPQGAFPFTSAALSVLPYHPKWTQLRAEGLSGRHVAREFLVGPFDITLNALDTGDELRLTLQYNASLLERPTVERLADDLLEIFEEVDAPRLFASPWSPPGQRIEERFAQVAARFPERVAIFDEGGEWSFAEVAKRADRLARALSCVPPEEPVGLQAYPSWQSVVGWLAILKAGRICLPLDPELPPSRRQAILADSGCRTVLSPLGPRDDSGTLAIEGEVEAASKTFEDRAEAAYLLYTSGSQGQPQGVLGTHAGLLHRTDALNRHFPWQSEEKALLRTPLGFVDAVAEWFGPLDAGATLMPFAQPRLVDSEELLHFMSRVGISRATLVPSLLGLLLRSRAPWPSTLRLCVASGEVLRPDLVWDFYSKAPFGSVLLNLYGSTECAGDITWFDTRQLESGAATVPLGLPLGRSRVQVVDDKGRPLGEGEEGEIVVSGPGLALGYWKQPDKTHDVFADGWLRMGDRGVWSRGLLEFRGRRDRSLKVRGWRVDLQEVEAVLETVPGVREAVALPGDDDLRAWLSAGPELDTDLLWRHLGQHLPPAMRPSQIRQLERLPRLPSGKIDRERLDDESGRLLSRASGGGGSELEEQPWRPLAELWEQVLKVPEVGPHSNFFDLGGHSLSAVELSHRIKEKFGRVVAPGLLVELPTVALLWNALRENATAPVLVEMRAQGQGALLCLIPGAWGGTIGFHKMVGKLKPGPEVVGLEYDGTEPAERANLKSVARRFCAELTRHRPGGPFTLFGYSMGGLLAYEMAKILGSQVQHLVLLDAAGPGIIRHTTPLWRNRLQEVWTHLQILARSRPRNLWDRVINLPARRPSAVTNMEQLHLALAYMSEFREETGLFNGPVTLLRMSYQPDWMRDPLLGWGEVLPQLQVRTIVGLHGPLAIEEPVVNDVVGELEKILGLSPISESSAD